MASTIINVVKQNKLLYNVYYYVFYMQIQSLLSSIVLVVEDMMIVQRQYIFQCLTTNDSQTTGLFGLLLSRISIQSPGEKQ